MVVCRPRCERRCVQDAARVTADGEFLCMHHWTADVLRRHAAVCPCPQAAYRVLQAMFSTAWPRDAGFIRGLVNLPGRHRACEQPGEPEGGHIPDRELAAILAALVRGGVLLRLADGRYVWSAAGKDELAAPFVAGPVRGDGTAWEEKA